jgi:hypothetical protein
MMASRDGSASGTATTSAGATLATAEREPTPTEVEATRTAAERARVRAAVEADNKGEFARRNERECRICVRPIAAGQTALLPCMDTVCRDCLQSPGNVWPLPCIDCGAVHTSLPNPAAAASLPANLVLETALARTGTGTGPGLALRRCTLCEPELPMEHALAVEQCNECTGGPKLLCADHVRRHRLIASTKAHTPAPLGDDAAAAVLAHVHGRCLLHNEPMKRYCSACDKVACLECTVAHHPPPAHTTVPLDDALVLERTAALSNEAGAVRAQQERLTAAMVACREAKAAGAAASAAEQQRIQRLFADMTAKLKQRCDAFVDGVAKAEAADAKRLDDTELVLRARWLAMQGWLRLRAATTDAQAPVTPAVLAAMARRLEAQLHAAAAERLAPVPVLQTPRLVLDDEAAVLATLDSVGRLVLPASAPQCTLRDSATVLAAACVGQPATLTLDLRTALDQPVDPTARTDVHALLVYEEPTDAAAPTVAVALTPTPGAAASGGAAGAARALASARLTFTPTTEGGHVLTVLVNGDAVPGSPWRFACVAPKGLYEFGPSFTFTNAGATGPKGPTLAQLQAAYAAAGAAWARNPQALTMTTQGLQQWRVPRTALYRLTVVGAHGAMSPKDSTGTRGGRGARLEGTVALQAGAVLRIVVGQAGSTDLNNGGGGGASFVHHETTATLLMLAGGGGGTRFNAKSDGLDASVGRAGVTDENGGSAVASKVLDNTVHVFNGGVAVLGRGGRRCKNRYGDGGGDGGAGWLGDGEDDEINSTVATALSRDALGGGIGQGGAGGFGGGGSGHGSDGGGGGGGYTGGNGGWIAGGGGSYVDEALVSDRTLAIDVARAYTKGGTPVHGYVTITVL